MAKSKKKQTSLRAVGAGVTGAFIGVMIGVFFAPESGKKNREKIVKTAKTLRKKR